MDIHRLDSLGPRGWPDPVVTVGNFDGVHRGHQALAAAVIQEARALAGTSVALTFDPHPSKVLSPEGAPSVLMTLEQKAEVLAGLGLDRLAVLPFTRELAALAPEKFARLVLKESLGSRAVVVGSSFRFGSHRAGDLSTLRALGASLGFRVLALEPVIHEGAAVSSTRIREALAKGAVEEGGELLGRRFFVDGRVVMGAGRGRTLGIPTANLDLLNETLPGSGVYACSCRLLGGSEWRRAVSNVGRRPTFGGGALTLEAHLLDFEGDLYGRLLRVEFASRLREERKFPSPEALKEQVLKDIAQARERLLSP